MTAKKEKKEKPGFVEILLKLKRAGIRGNRDILNSDNEWEQPDTLEERIKKIQGITNTQRKTSEMIYFIMYDIEDNKIRRHVSKYLINKGCIRIQRSVFLVNTQRAVFGDIAQTLKEVNEVYENNDSIILVPVSTDEISAMKVIGYKIELDFIKKNKTTIIF